MPANEKDDGPGLTAELAEETAAVNQPWPAEWPQLRPLLNLSRIDRAAVFESYADIAEKLPELHTQYEPDPDDVKPDPARPRGNAGRPAWAAYATDLGITVAVDMGRDDIVRAVDNAKPVDYLEVAHNSRKTALVMRLVAKIEDVIALAAVDPDATKQWMAEAGDWDVLTMFLRYAQRTQLGEASSSGS